MSVEYAIAVDLGTSGAKAAAITRSGSMLASAFRGYETSTDGKRVEQDPEDWEAAAVGAIREALAEADSGTPSAIALTGQMQDLVLEGLGRVPAILYSDTRAGSELSKLDSAYGLARLASEAGNAQDASSLAAKLLLLEAERPGLVSKAEALVLGAHDHVFWRFCGAAVTDPTTASTTGLLDLRRGAWNRSLLEAIGVDVRVLPAIGGPLETKGALSAGAAAALGLPAGLPVIHCAGDAATTTIGSGAGVAGHASVNLGTSGWLALTRSGDPVDPSTGVYNLRHPDGRSLVLIGAPATAAGNLDWYRKASAPGDEKAAAFDALNAEASAAKPASILYLPYLSGERSPFKDPDARAAFLGLGAETTRGDMARAVLEGVAFSLRAVRDAMASGAGGVSGGPPDSSPSGPPFAFLAGGGARSPLWCSIIATVLGVEAIVPERPEDSGVRGAVIQAGIALGWFGGYGAPEGFLPLSASYRPREDWSEAYERLYPAFIASGEALRRVDHRLALACQGR